MRVIKSNEQLKRDYWSKPEMYFTPMMVDAMVQRYGDKSATAGEAAYMVRERVLDLLSRLPFIGKLI